MDLEKLKEMIDFLDALSDQDFDAVRAIILIRGMKREIRRRPMPKSRGAQENEAHYKLLKGRQPDSRNKT